MLIWYFCEPKDITFTHKPLDTHDKGHRAESYQNLINGLFENLETLDITGLSDFSIYSHSTTTNQFCLGIIICRVYSSFDYLIYPYYPAYMG